MTNGLKLEITEKQFFAEQDIQKKLNMMFKAQLHQQKVCGIVSGGIDKEIKGLDERVDTIEKDPTAKINKAKIAGLIGGATIFGVSVREIANVLLTWLD